MSELAPITAAFASWSRKGTAIDQILLHESVTASRQKTIDVLKARSLGVHLIVDRDGSVSQHVPLDSQCAHAGSKHNRRSIAIEVVNRYYGAQAGNLTPTIPAVWAHRGVYILPTTIQCEAVWRLVLILHERYVTLPLSFPGVTAKGFSWGRLPLLQRVRVPPGVMAHHRTDHADGLFAEHYCVMRMLGFEQAAAFEHTRAAASSGARLTPIPEGPTA